MARRIDPSLIPDAPSLEFEQALWGEGLRYLAGIDEAGRGALAGPVFAGAVILPDEVDITDELDGVRDSKELSPQEREQWAAQIKRRARAWAVGSASAGEIDQWGIMPATRLAALRAVEKLKPQPQHLLADALKFEDCPIPQTMLWKGDARSLSIAAASVLAKVARDAELRQLHTLFPAYGFEGHKGYATAGHLAAITALGPCEQHRQSFNPMRAPS